jgi:hypothetical protein
MSRAETFGSTSEPRTATSIGCRPWRRTGARRRRRDRRREHSGGSRRTARNQAASVLLDRGYGKPGQHVELDITHYDRMTEAELEAIIEGQV